MNNNLYEVSFSNAKIGCNNMVFSILRFFTLPLIFLLIITFGLAFYANNIFWIFFVIELCIFFLNSYLQGVFNRSYDYLFVDNTLRFSRVLKGNKRYKVDSFDVKDIQMIYLDKTNNFYKKAKQKNLKKINATANLKNGENLAINYISGGKEKLILIKFDRTFLTYILRRVYRNKLDEELVKFLSKENE